MTSVRKSPNMMSTTGRMPVIEAPSPSPVIPASEIGESITRSAPNSSTSPESTLNGVPASATSSPITKTVGSRRNSSASASFTACAREISRTPSCSFGSSRTLGVDMLVHLGRVGEGRLDRALGGRGDLRVELAVDALEFGVVGEPALAEPRGVQSDRVTLGAPPLLLLLRAVV